jgi:predicted HD phosphohydrolase
MGRVSAPRESRPDLAPLLDALQRAGSTEEPNEDIPGLTILHHGLQCAVLLRSACPGDPELQLAGLLHDLGHVVAPGRPEDHGSVGAAFVRPLLGARVAALIEAHVPAKRYLVTTDRSYPERLSRGSLRTLTVQGERMTADEMAEFRAGPHADAALRLRMADEAAKDPAAEVPDLDWWMPPLLAAVG